MRKEMHKGADVLREVGPKELRFTPPIFAGGIGCGAKAPTVGDVRRFHDSEELEHLTGDELQGRIAMLPDVKGEDLLMFLRAAQHGASGVITLGSSSASHGPMIIREYGIPGIVRVRGAQRLENGQQITIYDGNIHLGDVTGNLDYKPFVFDEKTLMRPKRPVMLYLWCTDSIRREPRLVEYSDGIAFCRVEIEELKILGNIHPAHYVETHGAEELADRLADGLRPVVSAFHEQGKPFHLRSQDFAREYRMSMEGSEEHEPDERAIIEIVRRHQNIADENGAESRLLDVQADPMKIPVFRRVIDDYRGVLTSISDPEHMFMFELLALKRLTDEGYDNIGLFPPMVRTTGEFKEWRRIANDVLGDAVRYGLMIETPEAADSIREFFGEGVQFIVFGPNDLTGYTLGLKRTDPGFDENDPRVVGKIEHVIDACNEQGVPSWICGARGADPRYVSQFIYPGGRGIAAVSVSSNLRRLCEMRNTIYDVERSIERR